MIENRIIPIGRSHEYTIMNNINQHLNLNNSIEQNRLKNDATIVVERKQ